MSMWAALPKAPVPRELPLARPLDEAVWQAWVLKGRMQEERSRVMWGRAVRCILLAGLLSAIAASIWPFVPYQVVIRFIVAAGATAMMFRAFALRDYVFGTVFGTLVLLYNPVAPLFSLSGQWQRALAVLSAYPLIVSFTWRASKGGAK